MIKGGTFAHAGPGGYAEAAYRDGSRFSASVAYGDGSSFTSSFLYGGKSSNQRGKIESYYPSSDEEGEDSDD